MAKTYEVIRAMSGQDSMLVTPKAYMAPCKGDANKALVLASLVFWSGTKPKGEWFYKTTAELGAELEMSSRKVRTCIDSLIEILDGALEKKIKKANGAPTTHYRINQEKLISVVFPPETLPDVDLSETSNGNDEIDNSICQKRQNHGIDENVKSITDLNQILTTDLKTKKSDSSRDSKSKKSIITDHELKTIWNESVSESEYPEQAQSVRVVPAKASKDILKTYEIYRKLKLSEEQEPLTIQEWLPNYFSVALDFRATMNKPDGSFNWKITLEYACRTSSYEKILNWSANS